MDPQGGGRSQRERIGGEFLINPGSLRDARIHVRMYVRH